MSYSIKKGDAVIVIAGEDKGKSGQVDKVISGDKTARVVVKGSGLKTEKHFVKPRSGREKGGIVEKERAIDISNVMIVCPSCGKPTKVGHKITEDEKGKSSKERICKKCGASLDNVSKSKAKTAAKKTAKTASKSKTATKKTAKKTDEESK